MLSVASLGFRTFLSPHASRAKGFSRFSYALPSAGKQRPRAAPWFIPEPLWSGLSSSHHHRTHVTLWRPSFFWSNCKLLLYPLPPLRVSNWEAWSCPMEFFNHSNRQLYQGKLCWKPDHEISSILRREKRNYAHRILPYMFAYPGDVQQVLLLEKSF